MAIDIVRTFEERHLRVNLAEAIEEIDAFSGHVAVADAARDVLRQVQKLFQGGASDLRKMHISSLRKIIDVSDAMRGLDAEHKEAVLLKACTACALAVAITVKPHLEEGTSPNQLHLETKNLLGISS